MIGWYVHHHGSGHLHRMSAVLPHIDDEVTVLTSLPDEVPGAEVVRLPFDHPVAGEQPGQTPPFLHYAPPGVRGLSDRMAAIAAWIARERPRLMVVDVSVEVALLANLCGVSTCIFRQQGLRADRPHQLAWQAASLLLAPWPAWFERPGELEQAERTVHVGGFSRFDGRPAEPLGADGLPGAGAGAGAGERELITVLLGRGGGGPSRELLESWARAHPDRLFAVLGRPSPVEQAGAPGEAWRERLDNLLWAGNDIDPWPWICSAHAVIACAGHNAVMEVAAADRPLIAVAEHRPFEEQAAKASALNATGTGVGILDGWPGAVRLGEVIELAVRERPNSGALSAGAGARVAAAAIETAAGGDSVTPTAPQLNRYAEGPAPPARAVATNPAVPLGAPS